MDASGVCRVGAVALVLDGEGSGRGITGWAVSELSPGEHVDGLAAFPSPLPAPPSAHPNGAVAVDHVVVTTPDVARTVAAITEALGVEPRRTREHRAGDRPLRQTFFRLGEPILEVVGPSEPELGPDGGRPASFWGVALTVEDLDWCVAALGEHATPPRQAVQPGRRISAVAAAARLGTRVALMSAAPGRA